MVRCSIIRTISCVASAVVLMVVLGCAGMPPAGPPGPATDDLAAGVLDKLVSAYERRDVPEFMTLVSARYAGGYGDLQEALEDTLGTALSIELTVKPERIWESEDGIVFMDVGWAKTVTRKNAPENEITFGTATLAFIRYNDTVLKLFSQDGNPIFP